MLKLSTVQHRLQTLGCSQKDFDCHKTVYTLGNNSNGLVKAELQQQKDSTRMVVMMDLLSASIADDPPANEEVSASWRAGCA